MLDLIRRLLFLPPEASSAAPGVDLLHAIVIGTGLVGAAGVAIALAYFFVVYRDRPGPRARPPKRRGRLSVELVLSATTLGLFLAFWVVGFRQYTAIRETPPGAMRVYVVAKQWMWEFAYPDGRATQDELRVPVDQPVELVMTSRDVIHSFYVGAFRLKQDVIPGRMVTLAFTPTMIGRYDLLCAEYCGNGHSRMRGAVVVMSEEDYARWAATGATDELAAAGLRIAAERGCLRCHTVDGTPHLGPTFAGLYGSTVPLSDGTTVRADDEYLTDSMMDPEAQLVRGYPPIMPSYLGQLSGADAGAILEYLRSLAGGPTTPPAPPPRKP